MADWRTYTWHGEPLTTIIGGIADDQSDILGLLSNLLQAQADLLYLIADLMEILEALDADPEGFMMAAIVTILLNILDAFMDLLTGDFYMLTVFPRTYLDTFGPEGFTDTVVNSFDDQMDSSRPQFGASDSVCALSFYWNQATMTELYTAMKGLGILFPSVLNMLQNMSESVDGYVPYDTDDRAASIGRRTAGQPPDWRRGTLYAMFWIMQEVYGPLNQLRATLQPRTPSADFLRLLAASTEGVAQQYATLSQELEDIATLLNASMFTAARLEVPLETGGNAYLQESFEDAEASLVASGSYSEDYYSVGIVIVTGALGCPILDILGGT